MNGTAIRPTHFVLSIPSFHDPWYIKTTYLHNDRLLIAESMWFRCILTYLLPVPPPWNERHPHTCLVPFRNILTNHICPTDHGSGANDRRELSRRCVLIQENCTPRRTIDLDLECRSVPLWSILASNMVVNPQFARYRELERASGRQLEAEGPIFDHS